MLEFLIYCHMRCIICTRIRPNGTKKKLCRNQNTSLGTNFQALLYFGRPLIAKLQGFSYFGTLNAAYAVKEGKKSEPCDNLLNRILAMSFFVLAQN